MSKKRGRWEEEVASSWKIKSASRERKKLTWRESKVRNKEERAAQPSSQGSQLGRLHVKLKL